jgi:hypothetical protein
MNTPAHRAPARPAPEQTDGRRRTVRVAAASLSGVLGVLYLVLLLLVRDAESGEPENTFGAYLFLGILYLAGAGLLAGLDRRPVWVVGAVVQVGVIVLFGMFGAGLFGPGQGVFDYEAVSGLHMAWWAAGITGAQVLLLGLLSYLALAPADARSGR